MHVSHIVQQLTDASSHSLLPQFHFVAERCITKYVLLTKITMSSSLLSLVSLLQ